VFREGRELGKAAVAPVTDAPSLTATVLASSLAPVALSACFREYADHMVAGSQAGDGAAGFFHHSCDLVTKDNLGRNAAPKHTGHHRPVMMAEPASGDAHQCLVGCWFGRGNVSNFENWGIARLL